ncbi:MAG: hypothetical protein NT003_00175 [Candidatus Magasanikbacteria bacterium]|nr:hypothetical protein [Candidatus Magasanikbacteria bacterium]
MEVLMCEKTEGEKKRPVRSGVLIIGTGEQLHQAFLRRRLNARATGMALVAEPKLPDNFPDLIAKLKERQPEG